MQPLKLRRFLNRPTVFLAAAIVPVGAILFSVLPFFKPAYGLKSRPDAPAYFNFPDEPEFRSETNWILEPAFPNVTFAHPVFLEPEPGTDRFFIGELDGKIMGISTSDPMTSEKTLLLDLSSVTQGGWDSGLLGLTFHPEYGKEGSPNRDYIYVFYSYSDDPVLVSRPPPDKEHWTRLSRFVVDRETGLIRKDSELVLINQFTRHIFHAGGGLFFHPEDGFLYISTGDEGGGRDLFDNSQRIDRNLFSGVLRIDVDRRGGSISHPIRKQPKSGETAHYYIPSDNPFVGVPDALEEFFAIGTRSPHRMTYDPVDNLAWIGDVGQAAIEWVSVLDWELAPQNFRWKVYEGSEPGFMEMPEDPIGNWMEPAWEYGRDEGRSITGGYVYRGSRHPSLYGKYICADFGSGKIWALAYSGRPVKAHDVEVLAIGESGYNYHGGIGGITSFGRDHDDELYILRHGIATKIERLVEIDPREGNVPELLSETGAFADLETLEPAPGLIPYTVNTPQWTDEAAAVSRWISVPSGEKIGFDRTGHWGFPAGTVLMEQFDWHGNLQEPGEPRRLETRFLVAKQDGSFYGISYRWRPDGSDADLITREARESIQRVDERGRSRNVFWSYLSPANCMECHTPGGGYVLGVNTRQLNTDFSYPTGRTDNQLRTWSGIGLVDHALPDRAISGLERMAALDDESASVELRVRSFLHANCAHCHGATPIRSLWNGNINQPLAYQGLIFGPLAGDAIGEDYHVVAPQDVAGSVLHRRAASNSLGERMPPLGATGVNREFVALLERWISELPRIEQIPPVIRSAVARDAETLAITFSEALQPGDGFGGAEDPYKYQVSGGVSVRSASLADDQRTVLLTTSALQSGVTYTIRVSGVGDRAQQINLIAPGAQVEVTF